MLEDLKDLPSKGPLRDVPVATNAPVYIALHDTQPPPGQVIHTDQSTSALLRVVKPQKKDSAAGKADPAPASGKRALDTAGAAADARPAKKANAGAAAAPSAAAGKPSTPLTVEQLKAKTIPQLKELLKTRSLPVSGAKDELIRRLIDHQRASKQPAAK